MIGAQRAVGESNSVDLSIVDQCRDNELKQLLERYAEHDIFNMDETGLFYKLTTDKMLNVKGEKCSGGKLSKERITLALCTNMSGTEKLTPLVIGKSAKPRCFKNVKHFPCEYKSNKKA